MKIAYGEFNRTKKFKYPEEVTEQNVTEKEAVKSKANR